MLAFGFLRKNFTLFDDVLVENQNSFIPYRSLGFNIAFVIGNPSSSM